MLRQSNPSHRGQSEVIGQLLIVAILFAAAGLAGATYLDFFASHTPTPTATVEYDMSIEMVQVDPTTEEPRYVLTINPTSMERAERIEIYYDENSNQVGTISNLSDEAIIGDEGDIEIEDGDRFTTVAIYEGEQQIISFYTFDETAFLESQ